MSYISLFFFFQHLHTIKCVIMPTTAGCNIRHNCFKYFGRIKGSASVFCIKDEVNMPQELLTYNCGGYRSNEMCVLWFVIW